MKYFEILKYLTIVLLAVSCVDQNTKLKEKSSPIPQPTEVSEREQPKLAPSDNRHKDYVPGEILVKFKDGTDRQTIETIQGELHLETVKVVSKPDLYLMKILDGSSVESIMERLESFREVKYSEPNYVRTGF